jgi:putative transposase
VARGSNVEIYVHFVWGTFDRRPMISAAVEPDLFRVIADKVIELGGFPQAIGGTSDHVHLLARVHPSVAVARLMAESKGVSSHVATHCLGLPDFRWQSGYGAFSVSPRDLAAVEGYVQDQRAHHLRRTTDSDLELPN